eukprot:gene17311-23889_t
MLQFSSKKQTFINPPERETVDNKTRTNLSKNLYAPSSVSELPIQPKKISELRDWIKDAFLLLDTNDNPFPPVLAMCGNSGGCKSTLVELLCHELKIEVSVWGDDLFESDTTLAKQLDYHRNNELLKDFTNNSSAIVNMNSQEGLTSNEWNQSSTNKSIRGLLASHNTRK